jgi:hypothetical protein
LGLGGENKMSDETKEALIDRLAKKSYTLLNKTYRGMNCCVEHINDVTMSRESIEYLYTEIERHVLLSIVDKTEKYIADEIKDGYAKHLTDNNGNYDVLSECVIDYLRSLLLVKPKEIL